MAEIKYKSIICPEESGSNLTDSELFDLKVKKLKNFLNLHSLYLFTKDNSEIIVGHKLSTDNKIFE